MKLLNDIVKQIDKELKGKNRKDIIESYEKLLIENVEELSTNTNFFNLPLTNIFSVISKIDFNDIGENNKIIEIIQNIIKNTIEKHFNEKETILILQNINTNSNSLSEEEIVSILELITNCPILYKLCELFKNSFILPYRDYEYEIKQKDEEIKKLTKKILQFQRYFNKNIEKQDDNSNITFPIKEKPKDFQPNIHIACKEGDLLSVQWLIEQEKINPNIKVEQTSIKLNLFFGDTPLIIAARNDHLHIVQYLIEKQNVDLNIKGNLDCTPLHYACAYGHRSIAEYLILKGANINAKNRNGDYIIHCASKSGFLNIIRYLIEKKHIDKDIKGELQKTPLHYGCIGGHLSLVEYLISKGANINAVDDGGFTSLHLASQWNHINIVKFLISKGANKHIKNDIGCEPYKYAQNEEIAKILK